VSVLSTRFAKGDVDNLRSAPVSHETGYAGWWQSNHRSGTRPQISSGFRAQWRGYFLSQSFERGDLGLRSCLIPTRDWLS
jgi:hypothetical protein